MSAEPIPDPHHERRRIAEAFPRHRSRPRPTRRQPTPDELREAQHNYEHHVPSMFARQCLAEGCGEWPCRPYREAVQTLRDAGLLPDPPA